MNGPERLPTKTRKPFTGYLWGALAVLTCPCHLPILAVVLAGTTAGAFIGDTLRHTLRELLQVDRSPRYDDT